MTGAANPEVHREAVRRLLDGDEPGEVTDALELPAGTVRGLEVGLRTAFPVDLLEFRDGRARDKTGYPVPGQVLDLRVVDTGDDGDGVAYLDNGLVVFVQGAEPGETVTGRITVVRDRYAVARPVTSAHPDTGAHPGDDAGPGHGRAHGPGRGA